MKLHELTDAGLYIQELFDSGEDIAKALTDIQTEFNDKVISCGMVYRNMMVEAEVYKTESKRLSEKANTIEKRAEHLRDYVEQQMITLGIKEIKADTFSVKFHKIPPSVQIDNLDLIPDKYKRVIPESIEAKKRDIMEALSSGIEINGARLIKDRQKLFIK